MKKNASILALLKEFIPKPRTDLVFNDLYQLTVAVVLSAQTTDKAVNKATPQLFEKYPDFFTLAEANYDELKNIIKTIGLAPTKAKNLISLSKKLINEKLGKIVPEFEYLISLPGIGRKTANVILSEGFNIPRLAVDTHVLRVTNRLGLANTNNPLIVEKELCKIYPPEEWRDLHLRLVSFGRYHCTAKKPQCDTCPLTLFCHFYTKNTSKK